jgi:hypothetical protein
MAAEDWEMYGPHAMRYGNPYSLNAPAKNVDIVHMVLSAITPLYE